MESHRNIVDLPFDELYIIFSKLKLNEQINLALAHPELGDVFITRKKKRFFKIYLDDLSNRIWDPLFSQFGHMVDALCWHNKSTLEVLNYATKHCKSLQKIRFLMRHTDTQDEIRRRIGELKSLNTIYIRNFNFNFNYVKYDYFRNIEGIFESFQQLSNLRRLSVCNFHENALLHLSELTQLEELNIRQSYQKLDLGYICARLSNLRVLYYEGDIKNVDSIQALPQCCPLLEKLSIFPKNTEIRIPYFPKLKELTVGADIILSANN